MKQIVEYRKSMNVTLSILLSFFVGLGVLFADYPAKTDTRYFRIGDLQDKITSYGGVRAYSSGSYLGLKWPALYSKTDNAVIRRYWIACEDLVDEDNYEWGSWATYLTEDNTDISIFPITLKQIAKFEAPNVFVDGANTSANYHSDIDEIDSSIPSDRLIISKLNTSSGITITRKIYVFSQQYHDDYYIEVTSYKNTGNVDYDDDIELNRDIKNFRVGYGTRYSVCREAAHVTATFQAWGQYSWVTKRGEEYSQHENDVLNFTEATPISNLEWLRCGFSWFGQSNSVGWDCVGSPVKDGSGRLAAPQFAGQCVIHVDKSSSDRSDDPNQPVFIGWHAGDIYETGSDMQPGNENEMAEIIEALKGNPFGGNSNGGSNRFYEDNVSSIIDQVDPNTLSGDAGGTNLMITYGPWDIAHGDSIVIVTVEGVNGLDRTSCNTIGANWLKNSGSYDLPPSGIFGEDCGIADYVEYGTTTTDCDLYKNAWVMTGADSILQTFSRAVRNYNSDFGIPQTPMPPSMFEVASGGDKISLSWELSESESEDNFGGYRIYRGVGKKDTTYEMIAELDPGTTLYEDKTPIRGYSYFYYISSITDGSKNADGITNPTGILESNKFYTLSRQAASLKRKCGESFSDIRVVPNPYNIKASTNYGFPGYEDRIMFYDIPPYCKIKIYSERGDLIESFSHTDGSGDEAWNCLTSSRQEVASGVYIVYFEVTQDYIDESTGELLYKKGQSTYRKFVVIR